MVRLRLLLLLNLFIFISLLFFNIMLDVFKGLNLLFFCFKFIEIVVFLEE